jgi:hypothetical protein
MRLGFSKRLIGHLPQGHWQTITFATDLRHDGMVVPFVINGLITGASFLAYRLLNAMTS